MTYLQFDEDWLVPSESVQQQQHQPISKPKRKKLALEPIEEATFYVAEFKRELSISFKPLIDDLRSELTDPLYGRLNHNTMSARVQGCTGPMCRKARRDHERDRRRRLAAAKGQSVNANNRSEIFLRIDPIIEEYFLYLKDKEG